MRRRDFLRAAAGTALAWPLDARAERPPGVRQIGLLGSTGRAEYADLVEALHEGLRQLGYVDGKNVVIHYRWAEGRYDRLPDLAAELVRLKVDVILTHGTPGAHAARNASATIPIVAIVVADLTSTGLVSSLSRPGGNLTGQTVFFAEICAKRLELIKEAVPGATRVAALVNPANESRQAALAAMRQSAQALRVDILPVEARTREELDSAFATMARNGVHVLVSVDDPFLNSAAEYIAALAAKSRIPAIGPTIGVSRARSEGFMTYGPDVRDLWFRSAALVDQILRGRNPGDLPVQQATKFELIINLRAAQALGLAMPPSLLARADEVIE